MESPIRNTEVTFFSKALKNINVDAGIKFRGFSSCAQMSLTCFSLTFGKAGLEIISLLKLLVKDINFTNSIMKTTAFLIISLTGQMTEERLK